MNTTGSEIFLHLNDNVAGRYAALNLEVWSPTPWMTDVFVENDDVRHTMRNWLNQNLGPESEPFRKREGSWHISCVTMRGYCWYGFATEELMKRFIKRFPSPPKTNVRIE